MPFADYGRYDALGLAELVRTGQVSAGELLDEALARTAAVNPKINAVIHLMEGRARDAIAAGLPEGPFRGVPFLIKDLMTAYAGEPMRCGSRLFKDFVPPEDEELTRRYKAAGLVIFGKTNTPELGVSNVTEPELFGPTRNPWNLERTPRAVRVAARRRRWPHASCRRRTPTTAAARSARRPPTAGWSGLKPSRGRNPTGPQAPDVWWGFDRRARRDAHGARLRGAARCDRRRLSATADEAGAPGAAVPRGNPPRTRPAAHRVQLRCGARQDAARREPPGAGGDRRGPRPARPRGGRGAPAVAAGVLHRRLRCADCGRRGGHAAPWRARSSAARLPATMSSSRPGSSRRWARRSPPPTSPPRCGPCRRSRASGSAGARGSTRC